MLMTVADYVSEYGQNEYDDRTQARRNIVGDPQVWQWCNDQASADMYARLSVCWVTPFPVLPTSLYQIYSSLVRFYMWHDQIEEANFIWTRYKWALVELSRLVNGVCTLIDGLTPVSPATVQNPNNRSGGIAVCSRTERFSDCLLESWRLP